MTGATAGGAAIALAAGVLFEASYVLQTLEARRAQPASSRPGLRLLGALARRPRWIVAIAMSVGAFGLQVLALQRAPLSLVQPVLALGLVALLALSATVLHEHVGRREVAAAGGVIAGVAILALAAPARTGPSSAGGLAAAAIVLGVIAAAPFVVRAGADAGTALIASATAGDALAALAMNEVAGDLSHALLAALAWAVLAAGAGIAALAAEAAAVRRRAVTVVAPVVLCGQVAIPVLLAPLVAGESWSQSPHGATLIVVGLVVVVAAVGVLARSPATARSVGG